MSEEELQELLYEYNYENRKASIEKLLSKKLSSPDDASFKPQLASFIKEYFPDIDSDEFVYETKIILSRGVIEDVHQAQFLGEHLITMDLNVEYLNNCLEEIDLRYSFSKKFLKEKKFAWGKEEREIYITELNEEIEVKAFDEQSRIELLKLKFQEVLNSIGQLEKEFLNKYGHFIKTFYRGDKFIGEEENLIRFFFNCEVSTGTITSFYPIVREFQEYVFLNNALGALKNILSQPTEIQLHHKDPTENPFPIVFVDRQAYLLFERLYQSKKESPTPLAEFSFIYRRMHKDNLLQDHQKPEVFKEWLAKEPFSIALDNKFKTLGNCSTTLKEEAYQNAKELIKEQST